MQNTEVKQTTAAAVEVKVAVAVVKNQHGEILISQRQSGQHLAGYWEFPGGKLEPGESPEQALARELKEETGIDARSVQFLMRIEHQYAIQHVSLDVMAVNAFSGEAAGLEGQEVRWVAVNDLQQYEFPPANQQIIQFLLNR